MPTNGLKKYLRTMAENLILDPGASKEQRYKQLLPQLRALVKDEPNYIANVSNITAALKEAFGWLWVGCYFVDRTKENELVLGPFQGPIACTRIQKGKGVCGSAWEQKKTIIVDDVEQFPGHIACSAASKSEIVVPLLSKRKRITGVLDVDSTELASFDAVDQKYLEQVAILLRKP